MEQMPDFEPDEIEILNEAIETAKLSEYGGVFYSSSGPIHINKDGKLKPLINYGIEQGILDPAFKLQLLTKNYDTT